MPSSSYRPPTVLINHLVDLGHEADGFVEGSDDTVAEKFLRTLM
jgi:hypothetical protein